MTLACKSIFLFLFFAHGFAFAQMSMQFDQLQAIHGLADNEVNQIIQDEYGFIWAATRNGLSRFDGYSFVNFDTRSSPPLRHSEITGLAVQGDSLWIVYKTGIDVLNVASHSITRLNLTAAGTENFAGIFMDSRKNVWIHTTAGNLLRYKNDHVDTVQMSPPTHPWLKTPTNSIAAMGEHNGSVWWSRLDGNLYSLTTSLEAGATRLVYRGDSLQSKGCVVVDGSGNLWHSSNRALVGYDANLRLLFREEIATRKIALAGRAVAFVNESNQAVWLGDLFGNIVRLSVDKEHQIAIKSFSTVPVAAIHLYIDKQNVLWSSTIKGIYKGKIERSPVTTFLSGTSNGESASIRRILMDNSGAIYIGSYAGLYLLTPDKSIEKVEMIYQKPLLVYDMLDDDDDLWIAAEGDGIFSMNKKTHVVTDYHAFNTSNYKQRYFTSLLRDSTLIWIGAYEGLFTFNPVDKKVEPFRDSGNRIFFEQNRVNDLQKDELGNLWVASEKGLYKIDVDRKTVMNSLPANEDLNVRIIFLESGSVLWLGTKNNGLWRVDMNNSSLKIFTTNEGLPNNTVNGIIRVADQLWISTEFGLSRFDPKSGSFKNFYKDDGFSDNEFNQKAFLKVSDNELIFGTIKGVNVFSPGAMEVPPVHTKVMLTSFSKYDGAIDSLVRSDLPALSRPQFSFAPSDRFFSFQFTLMDFADPEQNQFKYRVKGLQNNWLYLGTQRQISFNSLDAGEYTIEIMGATKNGQWSSQVLTIPIEVELVFYKTWWFILLCSVAISSLAWTVHRYRVRQALRLERLRTRIARDLHDELGSSLTTIGIYSDLAREQREFAGHEHLEEIASLSREASATLRDIVWAIDTQDDSLKNLLARLRDHMHQMLEVTGVRCELQQFNVKEDLTLPSFVRQNVYLIFKEGINNIAKHAKASYAQLKVEMDLETLRIELLNDGQSQVNGRESSAGNGLRNMHKRAEALGGAIHIRTEKGFSICLNLPLTVFKHN